MPKIRIIVAYSENRVIGKDGKIPWHLPEDMQHFKETTGNGPVIMGRKTYESIPEKFRPLPGRLNVILSRSDPSNMLWYNPNVPMRVGSLQHAIDVAIQAEQGKDIWIIGGGQVYNEALEIADEVIASEVKGEFEGDTFFPELTGWTGETIKEFDKFKVVRYVKDVAF